MYVPRNGQQLTNIISALSHQLVLCIDVISATNKLLLNMLVFQLKLALTKSFRYTLLVDSISLNANEAYANYLKIPTDRICTMIFSEDFYSVMGGDERAFATLIGNSQITVVMSHTSGNSAMKWQRYLENMINTKHLIPNRKGLVGRHRSHFLQAVLSALVNGVKILSNQKQL